ncbi:MaoC/PaaZ C-terminal domain-containing protein [Mesorhizobium sp. MSK_1335]|uniref:MaoC/PaaZ C-terminal domain-containing protein n=1 Tax=Mesorhizobium montanum TaxID=3072323 RepID=A0ABU4ZKI5_9HYPH|nr:MaoC/PaaZ C-terminal domain-containing protein [Mesorhizobium sp. MSK_1335]MDX8525903.1 MaoC/PaaZ C-terminal domain-containing protein [Mesorhizobium sp. MSK_1335]
MELPQFTAADVRRWAAFSGDWNPIHFDRRAANAVGAEEPFAHGMFVMLPLKQSTTNLIKDRPRLAEWIQLDYRFRLPTPLGRRLEFVWAGQASNSRRAELKGIDNGVEYILASMTEADRIPTAPAELCVHTMTCPISPDDWAFPYDAGWIAAEAIAFRQAMKFYLPGGMIGDVSSAFDEYISAGVGKPLLMHARHTSYISNEVLDKDIMFFDMMEIKHCLRRTRSDASGSQFSLDITISHDGRELLKSTLGLFVRQSGGG